MAMDIQSQTVNTALTARTSTPVVKTANAEKTVSKTAVQPEVVKPQAIEIKEKADNSIELPKKDIQEAVNKLQDYVDKYNRDLKFSIDDDTGRTVVRLLDSDDNVVKQYPSEEVLSLIHNLEQNKGLFIGQA